MGPEGQKRESSLIPMLLAVMAIAGVLVFSGIYIFAKYLSEKVTVDIRGSGGGKSVSVDTPVGSLKVQGEASEAELGLPFYPGSRRRKDLAATMSLDLPATGAFQVAAAEFETDDPWDKVAAWYRERLGAEAREKKIADELRFLMQSESGRRRVVILKKLPNGTRISMAHITEAETN